MKKSSVCLIGSDTAVLDFDADVLGMKAPVGTDLPVLDHHVTLVLAKKDGTLVGRFGAAGEVRADAR